MLKHESEIIYKETRLIALLEKPKGNWRLIDYAFLTLTALPSYILGLDTSEILKYFLYQYR